MAKGRVCAVDPARRRGCAAVSTDCFVVFEWYDEGPQVGDTVSGFLDEPGDLLLRNLDRGRSFSAHVQAVGVARDDAVALIGAAPERRVARPRAFWER